MDAGITFATHHAKCTPSIEPRCNERLKMEKSISKLASMGSKVTHSFDATNGAHLHVSVCSIFPFPRLVQVLDAPMSILKDGKEMAETLKEQLATARTRMHPDGLLIGTI